MPTEPRPLPDESERRQAVRERARNVLVDAGAGTGKTTLVHGAETAQLPQALGGRFAGPVPIAEVEETVRTAGAVLRMESQELENYTLAGVDLLVEGMINTRDVAYIPDIYEPDLDAVRKLAAGMATELSAAPASSRGGRWLQHVAARLREAAEADSAAEAFQRVHEAIGKKPDYRKGRDFDGDDAGWDLFQQLQKEWRGQLLVPLDQWMGARIARTRGGVEALYDGVREERGV